MKKLFLPSYCIALICIFVFTLYKNKQNEVLSVKSDIKYPKVPSNPYRGLNYTHTAIKKHYSPGYVVEQESMIVGCNTADGPNLFDQMVYWIGKNHKLPDNFYIKEIEINQQ